MKVASSAQFRMIDQAMVEDFAFPNLISIENAGRKASEFILEEFKDHKNFLIICGSGNNGADGLVIARYLNIFGKNVRILFATSKDLFSAETLIHFEIISRFKIDFSFFNEENFGQIKHYLSQGAIIIDAMLGTGIQGKLKEPYNTLLAALKGVHNSVVAIDIPTGLNGDTGNLVNVPLKCDFTLTFQLPKLCHFVTPAANYCGKVKVLDIYFRPEVIEKANITTYLIDDDLIREWYIPRESDTHKGTYGHVLVAGGSKGKAGAIALCARAAIEIGSGLCTAFIPGSASCAFHRTTLENMSIPYGTSNANYLNATAADVMATYFEDKSVVGVGPGLGQNQETHDFLTNLFPHIKLPLVLDADALNLLAEDSSLWQLLPIEEHNLDVVITPHPGEMARLLHVSADEVQQHRFEAACDFAKKFNVIVVLKGAGTIITTPKGNNYICSAGNPGMSTAGSGDVLTGIISGLIAQGYSAEQAAAMGVYLHAKAGDEVFKTFGHEGVTAYKITTHLGLVLKKILQ